MTAERAVGIGIPTGCSVLSKNNALKLIYLLNKIVWNTYSSQPFGPHFKSPSRFVWFKLHICQSSSWWKKLKNFLTPFWLWSIPWNMALNKTETGGSNIFFLLFYLVFAFPPSPPPVSQCVIGFSFNSFLVKFLT